MVYFEPDFAGKPIVPSWVSILVLMDGVLREMAGNQHAGSVGVSILVLMDGVLRDQVPVASALHCTVSILVLMDGVLRAQKHQAHRHGSQQFQSLF